MATNMDQFEMWAKTGCIYGAERKDDSCSSCPLVCKDHHIDLNNNFNTQWSFGRALYQIEVTQKPGPLLPAYIPSHTHRLLKGMLVTQSCVSADLGYMLSKRVVGFTPKNLLGNEESLRSSLRIPDTASLITLLHGQDDRLEWFFTNYPDFTKDVLAKLPSKYIVGPTFSVSERIKGYSVPREANLINLRRHNRIIEELCQMGFAVVPNLYAIDRPTEEELSKFLIDNPTIHTVNRDLSKSTHIKRKLFELRRTAKILKDTGRVFHVILQGVGMASAKRAAEILSDIGCTFSFVTSDPMVKAYGGERIDRKNADSFLIEVDHKTPREALISHNMKNAEHYFSTLRTGSSSSLTLVNASSNIRPIEIVRRAEKGKKLFGEILY